MVASDLYLEQADSLAIIVPVTVIVCGWCNYVCFRGRALELDRPSFAMTEQPRTVTRTRLVASSGSVDAQTMGKVDLWLRDFLGLP